MAHFYAEIKGQRGPATRMGSKNSGIRAHIRGWNHGVRVEGTHYETQNGKPDSFAIFATSGSNGNHPSIYLGEVVLNKKGEPRFKKAKSWQKNVDSE